MNHRIGGEGRWLSRKHKVTFPEERMEFEVTGTIGVL